MVDNLRRVQLDGGHDHATLYLRRGIAERIENDYLSRKPGGYQSRTRQRRLLSAVSGSVVVQSPVKGAMLACCFLCQIDTHFRPQPGIATKVLWKRVGCQRQGHQWDLVQFLGPLCCE